jgi:hypothetical protein
MRVEQIFNASCLHMKIKQENKEQNKPLPSLISGKVAQLS